MSSKWDERVGWGIRQGHQVEVGEQDGRVRQSGQGDGGWEDERGRWGRVLGTGQLGWVISATMFLQTARMGTNLKVILEVISGVIVEVILDLVGDVSGRRQN